MTPLRAVPAAVDAAIAAAAEPQPIRMRQLNLMTSGGRPAALVVPEDVTESELAELCGITLTKVLTVLRSERAARPASRILVPS